MKTAPGAISCIYRDGVLAPANPYWSKLAARQFKEGEAYSVEIRQDRSDARHRAYFAAIHEAWANLSDDLALRFPDEDYLRRWALVKAGFCDERNFVCDTAADAKQIAALARAMDRYAVIEVKGKLVRVWTAQNQDYRSMNKSGSTKVPTPFSTLSRS